MRYDDEAPGPTVPRAQLPPGDGGAPLGGRTSLPEPTTLPVPAALPLALRRPLTRRRHVRVPGATAGAVERLAQGGADAGPSTITSAVSIVPGAHRPAGSRAQRPAPVTAGGAVLDDVVGEEEAGCAPGRHRRERPLWHLLQHVPGWRTAGPAGDDSEDTPDGADAHHAGEGLADDIADDTTHDVTDVTDAAEVPDDEPHVTGDAPDGDADGEPDDEADAIEADAIEADAIEDDAIEDEGLEDEGLEDEGLDDDGRQVALVRPYAPSVPLPAGRVPVPPAQRRRRRESVPAVRAALVAARDRIATAGDPLAAARVATEEAAALTTADVAALVLGGVEGPRVLWLHPGGPDSGELWGPATLAALLGLGHPVRRVVEGDPLAGGDPTALLAVPVPSGGAIAGSLLVRRHEPRAFSPGEQDVLSRLARMAGAALLEASAVPTAHQGGDTDPVTGWPGPRRLGVDVGAAVRTAERHGSPVSVLAAHLDGLERLRTELGDDPADEILRTLARALGEVLRVGDVAYRIGNDELALLLPATDAAGLPVVGRRLEEVVLGVVRAAALPGAPRRITLRTAPVPLDAVRAGADAVDAALAAVGAARQKVRYAVG